MVIVTWRVMIGWWILGRVSEWSSRDRGMVRCGRCRSLCRSPIISVGN